jgi:BMFP domain-containing protein YqiC
MIETPKFVEEAQKKISQLLENTPAADIERNLKALLGSLLVKMDLVTREEFEVQRELLSRARETLAQQEARITELEARQAGADKQIEP